MSGATQWESRLPVFASYKANDQRHWSSTTAEPSAKQGSMHLQRLSILPPLTCAGSCTTTDVAVPLMMSPNTPYDSLKSAAL